MDDSLKRLLLESVAGGKLVVLAGAGLSMAPPTQTPSAWDVAEECRASYLKLVGEALPLSNDADIETIAQWFWNNTRFREFIEKFIPWSHFRGPRRDFNAGHLAIADLLACHALEGCITTNYDLFVELAATSIGEPDFRAMREPEDLGAHYEHSPYLKVHGCCYGGSDRLRTIWCKEQLEHETLTLRTERFRTWLSANLQDRDLLVVGFWSDWAYLSDVLAESLTATTPRNLIVVDPSEPNALERKAPGLWEWAHRGDISFRHVQQSGADFLESFATSLGRASVTRLVRDAADTHKAVFGDTLGDVSDCDDNATLYSLRRVLTGTLSHAPVRQIDPDASRRLLVAIHARLLERGARFAGTHYEFAGHSIRLLSGSTEVLSAARRRYSEEPPSPVAVDRMVCVGAIADYAAIDVVRGDTLATIVRPGARADWETHERLLVELRDSA